MNWRHNEIRRGILWLLSVMAISVQWALAQSPTPSGVPTVSLPTDNLVPRFIGGEHQIEPVTTTYIDPNLGYTSLSAWITVSGNAAILDHRVQGVPPSGDNPLIAGDLLAGSSCLIGNGDGSSASISCSGHPISGSGTLFQLHLIQISDTPGASTSVSGEVSFGCSQEPCPQPIMLGGRITIQPQVWITGAVSYCARSSNDTLPAVKLNLTGIRSRSTFADGSGHYDWPLPGGSYTITPSRASIAPGSSGISTTDVIATQRHFTSCEAHPDKCLLGCSLTAADVNGDGMVNTVDVIAIQRFALGITAGIANVGKFQFTPASRTYAAIVTDQTAQDYDALIFGDVAAPFVEQSAVDDFNPNPNGVVRVVVAQPGGKILIGGDFTSLSPNGGAPVTRRRIARLNPDGTLDTAFDPNVNPASGGCSVYAIALQPDGKILVGGNFGQVGGQTRAGVARLDPLTGLADSFEADGDTIRSIVVQPNGDVLLGGRIAFGNQLLKIARFNSDGVLDTSFMTSASTDDSVLSVAVQGDGRILVGGTFSGANSMGGGLFRNHIARLDATTAIPDSFDPNSNGGRVNAIALQNDGKILVGGDFFTISGQARNGIARLDPATGAADWFNPGSALVDAIVVQRDGKILLGGSFNGCGGQERDNIARIDPTTGLADWFNPSADGEVLTIALQLDGKILLAGSFMRIGGQSRNYLARVSIPESE